MSAVINKSEANKYLRFLQMFKKLDKEMPVGQLEFLINAVLMDGSSLTEVAAATGSKMTTASRYLGQLSAPSFKYPDGLGLLKSYENPFNRRMKVIELTDEGKELMRTIVNK